MALLLTGNSAPHHVTAIPSHRRGAATKPTRLDIKRRPLHRLIMLSSDRAVGPVPARVASSEQTEGAPVLKSRFAALDGLRGIAALIVVAHHIEMQCSPQFTRWWAHGYLAVDFFFLLSGFVVARAYEDKLRGGTTLSG